jgi:large subunit ribosomal protein L10
LPATIIKEFRGKDEKPLLKAAYIDSDVFFGDDQVRCLTKLKTKMN